MSIDNPGERKKELKEYGRELGVSLNSLESNPAGEFSKFYEEDLIKRIYEAERSRREERLWIIAFLSAIAAIISALAAWFAVLK